MPARADLKIADFGVSAQLSSTLPSRDTTIGTPHWMAPEVISDGRYGYAADMWSLGITALELAEGRPPHWDVRPPMRVLFLIPTVPPPRLATAGWSDAFRDLVAVRHPCLPCLALRCLALARAALASR